MKTPRTKSKSISGVWCIEAREPRFAWIAAVTEDQQEAEKLLRTWQTKNKKIRFSLIQLSNAKLPILIIEDPIRRAYWPFAMKRNAQLPPTGLDETTDPIILYKIENSYAGPDGEDMMGWLDHSHVTRKVAESFLKKALLS